MRGAAGVMNGTPRDGDLVRLLLCDPRVIRSIGNQVIT